MYIFMSELGLSVLVSILSGLSPLLTVFAQFVSSQMGVNSQLQEMAADNARLKVSWTRLNSHLLALTTDSPGLICWHDSTAYQREDPGHESLTLSVCTHAFTHVSMLFCHSQRESASTEIKLKHAQ